MRFFFAGDFVLTEERDMDEMLDDTLKSIIKESDVSCVNFEAPLYSDQKGIKRGSYRCNHEFSIDFLKSYGFNLVLLANNHIMDNGYDGLKKTIESLDNKSISHIGAGFESNEIYDYIKYVIDDNRTLAIVNVAQREFGCSTNGEFPGYAWFQSEYAYKMIKKAVKECDFVIVNIHMGAEGWDIPLPEVREIYRNYIDQGVSLVVGHHPHVIQGREVYKGREIFYSLGNFAFDGDLDEGLVIEIEIEDDQLKTKHVYQTKYHDHSVKCEDNIEKFDKLSELLLEKNNYEYEKLVDEYSIRDYLGFERKYYELAMGLNRDNPDSMKKYIDHRIKGDPLNYDDVFLWHNIAIEAHRWVCIRAIEAMGKLR